MNPKASPFSAPLSISVIVLLAGIFALSGCAKKKPAPCGAGIGKVKDEALCVGRGAESLPGADEDYLADMDYGVTKDPREVAAPACSLSCRESHPRKPSSGS